MKNIITDLPKPKYMERIYKTKWGAYIDLSEIIAIDYKSILFCFPNIDKTIERYDITIYTSTKDSIIIAEKQEPEFFEDLVDAWKKYVKSQYKTINIALLMKLIRLKSD